MVQAPPASTVLGAVEDADLGGVEELARGEYRREVRESMPRDFVTMYHPDGTQSIVQLPAVPPDRPPSAKVAQERQQKIMHYVLNKKRAGKQWWFASPPPGWKPQELRYRCPVIGCERAGGLPDLMNLWRHIQQKHPGEVELYQGVLSAIKDKLMQAVPEDLRKLLDSPEPAVVDTEDLALSAFEEPQVPAETFGVPYACSDCDWRPKTGAKNPRAALLMHRRHKHEGGD